MAKKLIATERVIHKPGVLGCSPEIAQAICDRIAAGESLRGICLDKTMPGLRTVSDWLTRDDCTEFRDKYARARAEQQDHAADEQVDVARRAADGDIDPAGARVLCESLRWRACKLAPKKYGDRQHIEHSGTMSLAADMADARKRARAREGDA